VFIIACFIRDQNNKVSKLEDKPSGLTACEVIKPNILKDVKKQVLK